jgi:hypothetical protein
LPENVWTIGTVRHEATDFGERPRLGSSRQAGLEREFGDTFRG